MDMMDNQKLLYSSGNNIKITAKYKASDLEQDIINIAVTRLEITKNGEKEELFARLYPADLNRILKRGKNIYRELKITAKMLTGHSMVLDTASGFHAFTFISDCKYENSIMELKFTNYLKPYLLYLFAYYSMDKVALIANLKGYAKHVYEILQNQAYQLNEQECIEFTYRVSELKFMLGLANANDSYVQKYIIDVNNRDIDWDYLYDQVVVEKMYTDWYQFSKQVLDHAQAEINTKSDLCFEYKCNREGRFIKTVTFIVKRNNQSQDWVDIINKTKDSIKQNASADYLQLANTSYQYPTQVRPEIGNQDIQENMWITITKRGDFVNFLDTIGLTLDMINAIFEFPHDKVQLYAKWKLLKKHDI